MDFYARLDSNLVAWSTLRDVTGVTTDNCIIDNSNASLIVCTGSPLIFSTPFRFLAELATLIVPKADVLMTFGNVQSDDNTHCDVLTQRYADYDSTC